MKLGWLALLLILLGCSADIEYQDTNNNIVSKASLSRQWVILNYWATWCDYCIKEIKELNQFYRTQQHQAALFGINFDGLSQDELKTAVETLGIEYPVLQKDLGQAYHIEKITGIPATVIISPQGKVQTIKKGFITKEELEKILVM